VKEKAEKRGLRVVDATCPLVNKVHAEARRYATAATSSRSSATRTTSR